jgi:hypothetical protein
MGNAQFDKGREGFLTKQIDWLNDTIKGVLVHHATYTPNVATDQFLSAIAAGARVATSPALTNKSATNGVADADDLEIPGVSGLTADGLYLFQDTGNEATSRLIIRIDTLGDGTFPLTPNGGAILFRWDNGANKIFKL